MLKAIIYFENFEHTAMDFFDKQLGPVLEDVGKIDKVRLRFIGYWQDLKIKRPRPESEVAQEATDWIRKDNFDRVVFITDLDALGAKTTPDVSYGLRVIQELSALLGPNKPSLGPNKPSPLRDLLISSNHLIIILTSFPLYLDDTIMLQEWPTVQNVKKIFRQHDSKIRQDVNRVLASLNQQGPRIIVANRVPDDAWVARLIAQWV